MSTQGHQARTRPGQADSAPDPGHPAPNGRPVTPAPLLAAVLASEDALFRDPFADFIPSTR